MGAKKPCFDSCEGRPVKVCFPGRQSKREKLVHGKQHDEKEKHDQFPNLNIYSRDDLNYIQEKHRVWIEILIYSCYSDGAKENRDTQNTVKKYSWVGDETDTPVEIDLLKPLKGDDLLEKRSC